VNDIRDLLEEGFPAVDDLRAHPIPHLIVEDDNWYSCPASGCCIRDDDDTACDCGAERHNARIDAAIRELAAALRDIHDELFRYKQLAEQHIDEAEWDTDYERAMREVVEAALREELNPWTNAVAEALRDRAEKAEQALAAAREENAKLRWQRDYVIDIAEEYGGCDFTSEDVLSLDDLWTARKEAT